MPKDKTKGDLEIHLLEEEDIERGLLSSKSSLSTEVSAKTGANQSEAYSWSLQSEMGSVNTGITIIIPALAHPPLTVVSSHVRADKSLVTPSSVETVYLPKDSGYPESKVHSSRGETLGCG